MQERFLDGIQQRATTTSSAKEFQFVLFGRRLKKVVCGSRGKKGDRSSSGVRTSLSGCRRRDKWTVWSPISYSVTLKEHSTRCVNKMYLGMQNFVLIRHCANYFTMKLVACQLAGHKISQPFRATWIMRGLAKYKIIWHSCLAWRRLLPACAKALANSAHRAKLVSHFNIEQVVPLLDDDKKLFITSSRADEKVKCHSAAIMLFLRFQKHGRV